jgi:hypothetical protein
MWIFITGGSVVTGTPVTGIGLNWPAAGIEGFVADPS